MTYDAISFFGSVKELLGFTANLRQVEARNKVKSFSNFGDLLASSGCPFKNKWEQ